MSLSFFRDISIVANNFISSFFFFVINREKYAARKNKSLKTNDMLQLPEYNITQEIESCTPVQQYAMTYKKKGGAKVN